MSWKFCPASGCREKVQSGRCQAHHVQSQPALGWTQDEHRMRGRKLQRARQELFAAEPWCRQCRKDGRPPTLAVIRDHIVPLAEGGDDSPENIQPLCQACSDAKTRAEARRGQRRGGI